MTPQDRIRQAVEQLEATGARVSVRAVHRLVGGSLRDVSRLLRWLRPTRPTATVRALRLAIAEAKREVVLWQSLLPLGYGHVETRLHQWEGRLVKLQRELRLRLERAQRPPSGGGRPRGPAPHSAGAR